MKFVCYRYVYIIIITYEIVNTISLITIKTINNNNNSSYNNNSIQQVLAFTSTEIPQNINLQQQQQRRRQQWKQYATQSRHHQQQQQQQCYVSSLSNSRTRKTTTITNLNLSVKKNYNYQNENYLKKNNILSFKQQCCCRNVHSSSTLPFQQHSSYRWLQKNSVTFTSTTRLTASSSSSSSSNHHDNNDYDDNDNKITNIELISTTESSTSTTSSSILESLVNTIQLLKDNTDLITIIVIYFVEGALGISRLAQTLLLKDELQLGPAEMSAISGIFVIPWTIKPLYGFLSDSVPLFNYKRKSYLILAGIIGTVSYTLLGYQGKLWDINTIPIVDAGATTATTATVSTVLTDMTNTVSSTVTPIVSSSSSSSSSIVSSSVSLTIVLLLLSSACIAFSDVVADGIIVTKSRLLATRTTSTATSSTIVEPIVEPVISTFSGEPIIVDSILFSTASLSNNNEQQPIVLEKKNIKADVIVTTNNDNNNGNSASLQSLCWGASAVGSLLSAYFSGSILQVLTPREVFGVTAILPFAVAAIATTIQEQPVITTTINNNENNNSNVKSALSTPTTTTIEQNMNELIDLDSSLVATTITTTLSLQETVLQQILAVKDAFALPQIWKPTLFLFLWQSTPTAGGAFLYFIINDLHITTDALGRLQFATAISTLVGVILYNRYLQNMSIKSILVWTTLLSLPLGIIPPILLITHMNRDYNIPDIWLLYGDDVVLAALGQIGFLPTLVIAAKLCPPGIEAVLFATLMSIYNLAGTVGTEIGALLTKILGITESNFDNLILLTIICNVTSIWPLLLINWLNDVDTDTNTDTTDKNDDNEQDSTNCSSMDQDQTILVEASTIESVTNTSSVYLYI